MSYRDDLGTPSSVAAAPKTYDDYIAMAESTLGRGKPGASKILELANKALAIRQGRAAYLYQGYAFAYLERHSEAIVSYKKSLDLIKQKGSNSPELYVWISRSYYALSDFPTAVEYALKAIELDQDNLNAFIALGHYAIQSKKYQASAFAVQNMIRIEPNNPSNYILMALIKDQHLNDSIGAIKDYQTALSLGPDPENQIKAYRGISIALFSQKSLMRLRFI